MLLTGCFLSRGGSDDPRFSTVPGLNGPDTGVQAGAAGPGTLAASAAADELKVSEVLQAGQAITITFTDLPTLQQPYTDPIKADGTITLMQNKTFVAAGKNRRQLEEEIRAVYVPKYYQTMTVSVAPPPSTRFYYVFGDVKAPGRQLYIERLTVLRAISSAGDFTDFAKKSKVKVTRADGRSITINCKKAITHSELDLEVYPGDKIFVPRRFW